MPGNFISEIVSKSAALPPEKQQAVLKLLEELIKGEAQTSAQRPHRKMKDALAHLKLRVTEEDIAEARREM